MHGDFAARPPLQGQGVARPAAGLVGEGAVPRPVTAVPPQGGLPSAPVAARSSALQAILRAVAERRRLEGALRAALEGGGYREVAVPLLQPADAGADWGAAYRVLDQEGALLALRPDMTGPVARLCASGDVAGPRPRRLFYVATLFRRGPDGPLEIVQAGAERIGEGQGSTVRPDPLPADPVPASACGAGALTTVEPDRGASGRAPRDPAVSTGRVPGGTASGAQPSRLPLPAVPDHGPTMGATGPASAATAADAEVLALVVACLRAVGAARFLLAVGHAGYVRELLAGHPQHEAVEAALRGRDQVSAAASAGPVATALLWRGEVDAALAGGIRPTGPAAAQFVSLLEVLRDRGLAAHLLVEPALLLSGRYYTGLVFEVLLEGLPMPVGDGGRYDGLLGRYGGDEPAVGFALDCGRLLAAVGAG